MMKAYSPALILYLFASFFAVIGIVLKNEFLVLLTKPAIVPSILIYYLQVNKVKVNRLFLFAMLCSFSADMIVMFKLEFGDILIALLNIIMYLVFIYFSVKDISIVKISALRFFHLGLIVFGCLMIPWIILDLMTSLDEFTFNVYIIYGIILSLLASIIGFNHLNKHSIKTFYALIMCLCFIVSDVFFAIYNFYMPMEIFILLNVTVQFASYYYMVKYITIAKTNQL